jgi:hypothetical protein
MQRRGQSLSPPERLNNAKIDSEMELTDAATDFNGSWPNSMNLLEIKYSSWWPARFGLREQLLVTLPTR